MADREIVTAVVALQRGHLAGCPGGAGLYVAGEYACRTDAETAALLSRSG